MMCTYGLVGGRLQRLATFQAADVLWIDLFDPTREEEKGVEALLGLSVPTRQEMSEIEDSARLYQEGGALVMTAVVINGVAEGRPGRAPVTFVLTPTHLVSVRYADPVPFRTFETRCQRRPEAHTTSDRIFVSLLESIVERAADVLEMVQADLNQVSLRLFFPPGSQIMEPADGASPPKAKPGVRRRVDGADLQATLERLGRKNLMISILRESLLSLTRVVPYVRVGADKWVGKAVPAQLKQIDRDLRSLTAYEGQLSSEIVYLHDATLGLINLDQNRVIKVFSIAAVLFLPPTLVGTVYGMNFEAMPELKWAFGYPMALLLMVLSAVGPYWWFKRRGWL